MMIAAIKPKLKEPFPNMQRYWECPKTGLLVPKHEQENIEWREKLLREAENDTILQADLLAACKESLLYWINAFGWTYHQFDVDSVTGQRIESVSPHVPMITWERQDELFNKFEEHLKLGKDILIDKCRDMGASWCAVFFMHWLWLFHPKGPQLLELSRTEPYVDETGNMKALFQKHDKINEWLPEWMRPPDCLPGGKYRTKMHMLNILTGACIDGEATTEHAASGDRRLVALLDEFAKVKPGIGAKMRSATRDVAYMRIVNSTPAGAGTEYAKWKKDGTITVFTLDFWDHPQKGAGRYLAQDDRGNWQIRSPWFDHEVSVRSPREVAQEILHQDIESGDTFFTIENFHRHRALYACDPYVRFTIDLKKSISNDDVGDYIRRRDCSVAQWRQSKDGPLRVWTHLFCGRPDQSKSYQFGIDISKGQGASNSVVSIRCRETGEKIAEWRDANTPPYDMARIVAALALWCGGALPARLPFLKWETNGPGWDFGRIIVGQFNYPYYYRHKQTGVVNGKVTAKYGWHNNPTTKNELLMNYDRVMAHGEYINHSDFALEEALYYIHYPDGSIGPALLVEENSSARKTHGDCVMADALSLDDSEAPKIDQVNDIPPPPGSPDWRYKQRMKAKMRGRRYRERYDFRR
jgi:hypothetical protein